MTTPTTSGERGEGMTPGQAKWLRKLAVAGPQQRPRFGTIPCVRCIQNGWAAWGKYKGDDDPTREHITEAGRRRARDPELIIKQESKK